VLDYEKLIMKNLISLMIYETNKAGEIRLTRNPEKGMRNFMPTEANEIPPLPYFTNKLLKTYTIIRWFFVPSSPQELSKAIDLVNQGKYNMAEPDFDWSKKPPEVKFSFSSIKLNYKYFIKILSLLMDPSYHSIHDLYIQDESGEKGALLIIALKRYKDKNGSWPENLEEIKGLTKEENFIDTINGQSFVYKLADEGFVLYSKGKNGIDNGGIGYSGDKEKEDDIYIWPLKYEREKIKAKKSEETRNN
jgi:hypothetical protein